MRFAEGVSASDQRYGFFVIHRHSSKCVANVFGSGKGIGIAVRALRIDVDQPHLNRCKRLLKFTLATIALVAEPFGFRAPIDEFCFPIVFAAASKTKGFKTHRFHRDIAGQHHQVRPGNFRSIFLFDRPKKSARFVEIGIVGPAIERFKALLSATGTAAPIKCSISPRAMPSHANEKWSVMPVIGRPPVLRGCHYLFNVFFDLIQIERCKFLCIIEIIAKRIGFDFILPKRLQIDRVWPPKIVWPRRARKHLAMAAHHVALFGSWLWRLR